MKHIVVLGLLAAGIGNAAAVVPGSYYTSYSVTLDAGWPDVTNILMLETGANGGSTTWAFVADGDDTIPKTTLLENPFAHSQPVLQSLLIGIAQDFPFDAPGQKHVVLMMDPTAAALSDHIAWGTLFRNTLEEQLIAAIELATSGQDWPIITPGLNFIDEFAHGDAVDGILGPGGIPYSAWFNTGGAFTVMAFSDGQVIGSGVSNLVFAPAAVPEPLTLGFAGIGLLLLGWRVRRSNRD